MAARRQSIRSRQQNIADRNRQMYVYGNTVRQPEIQPERRGKERPRQPKRTSSQVRKNRKRALFMSPFYVSFLAVAAICAVFVCVQYLQMQSDLRLHADNISAMQKELAELDEMNTTAYNAAVDSRNIEEIRSKAINEMGMVYASQGRVIEYESPTSDYVKQYEQIPEDGVLAQSSE